MPVKRDWAALWGYCKSVGRCEVPGCRDRRGLSPHHVRKRSQGGSDLMVGPSRNIVCLCGRHHDLADQGRLRITLSVSRDAWEFEVL